jgi:hypothetical protein
VKLSVLVVAALVAVHAVPLAGARQPASSYDRGLGLAVRYGLQAATLERERALVKQVYVRCYRNSEAFEKPLLARFGSGRHVARHVTAYYAGGGDVHIRAGTCANARLFTRGLVRWDTAAAFGVLLHEALHRQGMRNERATSCFGNDAIRWAGKLFGMSDRKAERARVLAFSYSRRVAPPSYLISRQRCLRLIVVHDLSWWRVVETPTLEKLFEAGS